MRIDEVKISYPYLLHSIDVRHFAPRIITAMEWLIMETAEKCAKDMRYGSISVKDLFTYIFSISDVDKLVKPCLVSLRDMGVVKVANLYDTQTLGNILSSDIKLTAEGEIYHKRGALPAAEARDSIKILYDVYNHKIVELGNKQEGPGMGVLVKKFPEIAERMDTAPIGLVQELINSMKGLKAKHRYPWLTPSTEIRSLESYQSKEYHWTTTVPVNIEGPGILKVQDIEDQEILDAVMDEFLGSFTQSQDGDYPFVEVNDWDEELDKVFQIDNVKDEIINRISNANFSVISSRYNADKLLPKQKKFSNLHVFIVEGDQFKLSLKENSLVINVSEKILPDNVAYSDDGKEICEGVFSIKVGKDKYDITLGYVPKGTRTNIFDSLVNCVKNHQHEDYRIIIALIKLGLVDEFKHAAEQILEDAYNRNEHIKVITELNKITQDAFKKKYITEDVVSTYLVDKVAENHKETNLSELIEELKEKASQDIYKKFPHAYQELVVALLKKVDHIDSHFELYNFWKELKSIDANVLNYVKTTETYKSLYSLDVVESIFDNFESDNFKKLFKVSMPIEEVIIKLQGIANTVKKVIPEIEELDVIGDKTAMRLLSTHATSIETIALSIGNWDRTLKELLAFGIDEDICHHPVINRYNDIFKVLNDNVKYFYDDRADKFKKIFVIDTCALMNHSEMLDEFALSGENMAVVPVIVIDELDDNKKSSDEQRSMQARRAANKVYEFRDCEWLNLKDKFNPDYLPVGLDPERKDNQIISFAIKYFVKKPIFISDDRNACNAAMTQGIEVMSSEDFLMKYKKNVPETSKAAKGEPEKQEGKKDKKQKNKGDRPKGKTLQNNPPVIDKTKPISCPDLAKELGMSVFEFIQFCGNRHGVVTKKRVFNANTANGIRKEFKHGK